MKKSLGNFLKIAGFLALGLILLYFAFRGIAMDELGKTLREANFAWIGLSLLFAFLSFLARARRWMLLVHPLGYRPSYAHTYHALMVGYLSNFALPRLGEVTRCVTLGNRERIPVDSLIGTVIIERVVDLIMLFLILLALLLAWVEKFGTFFGDQVFEPIRAKMVDAFGGMYIFWLILAGMAALTAFLVYFYRKELSRFTLVNRVGGFVRGITNGLKTIYTMNRKWEFIFLSLLIWFLYILMTWVIVFSLEETSSLTFIDGVFLLVIGGLGMAAPVTAGFGAYHWITSRGLVYVYGLSLEQGGAYAILSHESNSLFTILLGAISYLVIVTSKKRKPVPTESVTHGDL